MNTIQVKRSDVIDKLKENRDRHIATYTEANENYRQKVVDALRERAQEIDNGGEISTYFTLPEPEDHTDDYDESIASLEWDQRELIDLDQMQFRQFVLDKWRWEQSFLSNTTSYTAAGAAR